MGDFGTLSSLGIASGALNYDVIDKLKKADEEVMINPMKKKMDLLQKKDAAISQFITIGSTVKSDILDLADGSLFAKVNTDVSGSSVSVEANDGVKPQQFNIDVSQLAQNDVFESKGFSSPDDKINSSGSSVKVSIGIGDNLTNITLKDGATLNDLKDSINNADIGITASIIDTGIGDNPYKLILKANDTGEKNIIQFNYSNIEDLGLNATTYTSKSYNSDTDKVNDSGATQTFKITANGTEYSMDVDDGLTVKDFIDKLNNGDLKDSDGNSLKVSASYDNGQIKFNLQDIGDISIDDTNLTTNFNDNTDFTNSNRLQNAQDAKFKYNGVEIQRDKNDIKDLIVGVDIHLNSTGNSTVNIKSNVDEMVKTIKQFVADYNAMMSNIQNLTAYNKDTGNVGLFQGDSNFTMLSSKLNNSIFGVVKSDKVDRFDRNGNKYTENTTFTAADVGFDLNRSGMISFDESKFKKAFDKNPDLTNRLFETMFTNLKTTIETNITGDNSNINLLDKNIKDEEKNYEKRMKSTQDLINTRYEIMAKQFAAYDEAINKMNVMSQSLDMAIKQAINSK